MQVFKTFLKVSKKYIGSMAMYFGICVAMTIMVFSSNRNNPTTKFETNSISIAVVDKDNSKLSKVVVDYLDKNHNIVTKEVNEDIVKDELYYQQFMCYVVIPEGFEKSFAKKDMKMIETLADDGMPQGTFIDMQLDTYVNSIHKFMDAGFDLDEAVKLSDEAVTAEDFVQIKTDKDINDNSPIYTLFLFLPYAIMSMIFAGILPVIIAFNEKERKNRTLISSLSSAKRTIGIVCGALVVATISTTAIVTVSSVILKDGVGGSQWCYAVLNVFIFMIVAVMILTFLSTLPIKEMSQISILTNIVGLGLSFLGGIFVPLEVLGDGVKSVGRFLPTYWYALAMDAISKGKGLSDLVQYFGLELAFGVVCLAAALAVSKIKSQKSIA